MPRERYSLLIDEFLRGCGLYRKQLTQQHWVVTKLEYAALRLKKVKAHEERLAVRRHQRYFERLCAEHPIETTATASDLVGAALVVRKIAEYASFAVRPCDGP